MSSVPADIASKLSLIDANKALISGRRPLSPQEAEQIGIQLKTDLTYTSNALEGNSLTLDETRAVLEYGMTIRGKPLHDVFEAAGHSEAYDLMAEMARGGAVDLLTDKIRRIHRLFYQDINYVEAGNYRQNNIWLGGAAYIPPKPLLPAPLMYEFEKQFYGIQGSVHPVELAAFAHMRLADIHPFVDGNGRTSRLLMNLVLLDNGYQLVSISPEIRTEYIDAVKASQNSADSHDTPFFRFLADEEIRSQAHYMKLLGISPSPPDHDTPGPRPG
ncbi:MAG: Fic family protein [Deltaproteobacteria bacterium]|jgi:Fic family protein|nr:Fic family protein [Deltaproteobacteria bacterium]